MGKDSLSAELVSAIKLHEAGDLVAAERLYRGLLQQSPDHADAWHLLGVLASQQGQLQTAHEHISRALRLTGDHPLLLYNLANVLRDQGDLAAAIDRYRRVAAMKPRFVPAQLALADCLERQAQPLEALQVLEHACTAISTDAELQLKTGELLQRMGRSPEALAYLERARELRPQDSSIHHALGLLHTHEGRVDDAIACLEHAIALDPQCVEARMNLASLYNRRRAHDKAAAHYAAVAQMQPAAPEVRNALGDACLSQGKLDEAREHYRHALNTRGDHLLWRLRLDLVGPAVPVSAAAIDDYRRHVLQRLRVYHWSKLPFELDELATSGCKPPISLAYHGRDDLEIKRNFARLFEGRLPIEALPARTRTMRIGFVVAAGSEGVFLRGMAGVLNHLSPGRFKPLVIGAPSAREKFRQAITNREVEFLPLRQPFAAAVQAIREARCDLLYDWEIGIDCSSYFLPFFRLAPVQCTSWGWPVTSGIQAVDYFVSSDRLEPEGAERHYSERLVRLQHLPNYYSPPPSTAPPLDRARYGLTRADHIYFCGQNGRKIHPDFDSLVAAILRRDPWGKLILIEAPQPHVTAALKARLEVAMPDCMNRVCFVPRMTSGDYLAWMAGADVVLDTLHYGGGANSTYDAFGVGAPVVTMPGQFHRSRYAAAAYQLMGLTDCIAETADQYVGTAVRIASDPIERRRISQAIAATRGCLFDNLAAVRELEEFFETAISSATS